MTIVYISIGSNLDSPLEQIKSAVYELKSVPDSLIISISSCFITPPLGPQTQPNYMNAAVSLDTTLTPESLLETIQNIELKQGRIRKERWGPRTLDLDIMLFGKEVVQTDRLIIPHYDMKNRAFMLWPLFEIAPQICFPDGESLKELISRLDLEKFPRLGKFNLF